MTIIISQYSRTKYKITAYNGTTERINSVTYIQFLYAHLYNHELIGLGSMEDEDQESETVIKVSKKHVSGSNDLLFVEY